MRTGLVGMLIAVGAVAWACETTVKGEGSNPSTGGSGTMGGAAGMAGSSSSGAQSSGGMAGTGVVGCSESSDCTGTAPICDTDTEECRGCKEDLECTLRDASTPHCEEGMCVECVDSDECPAATPVCGDNACRGCVEHSECESFVCDRDSGTCIDESMAVYVLAETGLGGTCGNLATPCVNTQVAADQLSENRPYLVLLPTNQILDIRAALPAVSGITVIGNDVVMTPWQNEHMFSISGGSVTFDGIHIAGADSGILCTGGSLRVVDSVFESSRVGIDAKDCNVEVSTSRFVEMRATDGSIGGDANGVAITCTDYDCAGNPTTVKVERSWFERNSRPMYIDAGTLTVENNVFVGNGAIDQFYNRIISVDAEQPSTFAFNTIVDNYEQCSHVGLVNVGTNVTPTSNISWANFTHENASEECTDQVWYTHVPSEYLLSETPYPGTENDVGNPLFVDEEGLDFYLQEDSPAVDSANPNAAPAVDYFGNPRSLGDGPDRGAIESH